MLHLPDLAVKNNWLIFLCEDETQSNLSNTEPALIQYKEQEGLKHNVQ